MGQDNMGLEDTRYDILASPIFIVVLNTNCKLRCSVTNTLRGCTVLNMYEYT